MSVWRKRAGPTGIERAPCRHPAPECKGFPGTQSLVSWGRVAEEVFLNSADTLHSYHTSVPVTLSPLKLARGHSSRLGATGGWSQLSTPVPHPSLGPNPNQVIRICQPLVVLCGTINLGLALRPAPLAPGSWAAALPPATTICGVIGRTVRPLLTPALDWCHMLTCSTILPLFCSCWSPLEPAASHCHLLSVPHH